MLDSPPPSNLKELLLFLAEKPNLKVQTESGKKRLSYKGFEGGCFNFDNVSYNFCLTPQVKNGNVAEIGLTMGQKGFIVERNDKRVSYLYGE